MKGKVESALVDDYVNKIDSKKFTFQKYINKSASKEAPFLIEIRKHNLS